MTVRRLTPRAVPDPLVGTGAIRGHSPRADEQRQELRDLLEGRYLVGDEESAAEIERLDIAERTILELELRERQKPATSGYDYDPLP